MTDDAELLRRNAHEQDQDAFGELVQRHVNLVYRAAARQLAEHSSQAEDVAQIVFTILARKSASLVGHTSIAGWLHTTTCFAVRDVRRTERHRRRREQEALTMHETMPDPNDEAWRQLRPVIDEELRKLGAEDGEAVLLRFFEDRSFAEIGGVLRVSEDAARMRVHRALERLRTLLERRGIASTGAALSAALSSQSAWATPAGLAATVTGAALAGSSVAGTAAAVGATAYFMGLTKIQIGIAGALVVAGASTLATGRQATANLRREIAARQPQIQALSELRRENERLQRATDEVAALRADAQALLQIQSQAADVRNQLRVAAQRRDDVAAKRQFSALTAEGLKSIAPLSREKRYAEILPVLDALIAAAPPQSYDMAVLAEMKGKIHFALQQYPESLASLEKATALAEQHGYFSSQQFFNDRLLVTTLRYQQKVTKNATTPWFWE